jgi:hypothetical protein
VRTWPMAIKKTDPTKVESIRHKDKRKNISTEELRVTKS